jgi:putative addiction module antidote
MNNTNALKLKTIGNSVGIIIPKEILIKLRIDKGDTLYLSETPRGIELTPYNDQLARQLEVAERVMRENREVLRKLAQ